VPIFWCQGFRQNDTRSQGQSRSAPSSTPVSLILGHQGSFSGAKGPVKTTPGPTRVHFLVPRVPSKRHPEPGPIPVSPILPIFWCQGSCQNDAQTHQSPFSVPRVPSKRHPVPGSIPVSPILPIFWCQGSRQNDARTHQSSFSGAKSPVKTTPGARANPGQPNLVYFLMPRVPTKRHLDPPELILWCQVHGNL